MKIPTPLPWACVYGTDGHHLIFAEDGPIARVAVRMDADEQQANADLLLGAPALLDALKTARRVLEVACGTKAPYIVEAFKIIDPAIAKAEGR